MNSYSLPPVAVADNLNKRGKNTPSVSNKVAHSTPYFLTIRYALIFYLNCPTEVSYRAVVLAFSHNKTPV
jgi:hypothetical protein